MSFIQSRYDIQHLTTTRSEQKLQHELGITSPLAKRRWAEFRDEISTTVGLDKTKEEVNRHIPDTLGRLATSEPLHARHILISGPFGAGKKRSARSFFLSSDLADGFVWS